MIAPGLDDRVYLTPDAYASGARARERLALRRVPSGYFEVPEDRLTDCSEPEVVAPGFGMPGGGTEVHVAHTIDASDLGWNPVGP